MFKNVIAVLLSLIFTLIIVLPTVIVAFDDSIDVSLFYNTSEEEKEKSQEKNIDKEFICSIEKDTIKSNVKDFEEFSLEYCFNAYKIPHIELSFPPPKLVS